MNDKKDEFKECIAREFEEIAREEEEFLENDTSLVVPEGTKEAVLARVREQIRAYEMEQDRKEAEEREEAFENVSCTGSSYCLCAGNGDYQYGRSGEDCADDDAECGG